MLACVGLNAAGILKRVADGKLRAHRPDRCLLELSAFVYSEADIRACAEAVREENGWVDREEIAGRMGVKVTVVAKWVNVGLLSPVATHAGAQHFDREAVDRFVAGHVFTEQAAEILGVGAEVVRKWTRNGRLKPVAGPEVCGSHRYLFRREGVERLCPENRLTAPQMAKRLGISRSQLGEWIKQGKVTPISGPGIDGCRHYLFAV